MGKRPFLGGRRRDHRRPLKTCGQKDKTPQWIMSLWYNCKGLPVGEPPGEDKCDEAVLVFDDVSPSPPLFDHPSRIELAGTWADNRPEGLRYGARGLEIYPVQASF